MGDIYIIGPAFCRSVFSRVVWPASVRVLFSGVQGVENRGWDVWEEDVQPGRVDSLLDEFVFIFGKGVVGGVAREGEECLKGI